MSTLETEISKLEEQRDNEIKKAEETDQNLNLGILYKN